MDGNTPLAYAVSFGTLEMARMLLDHGADTECEDRFGYTPLCHAASSGSWILVQLLLSRGANVEHINTNTMMKFIGAVVKTPLQHALEYYTHNIFHYETNNRLVDYKDVCGACTTVYMLVQRAVEQGRMSYIRDAIVIHRDNPFIPWITRN